MSETTRICWSGILCNHDFLKSMVTSDRKVPQFLASRIENPLKTGAIMGARIQSHARAPCLHGLRMYGTRQGMHLSAPCFLRICLGFRYASDGAVEDQSFIA